MSAQDNTGWRWVPVEPTEEMVAHYLDANRAYWNRTDAMPQQIGKWRTGTPSEAVAEAYRAMLAAAPQQAAPAPAPLVAMCKGTNCTAIDGRSHSPECVAEHDRTVAAGQLDTPGNRHPADRYTGFSGEPLRARASADQARAWQEGADAAARLAAPARCPYCDDTGDVHSQAGEWRGTCTCPAGVAQQAAPAQPVAWLCELAMEDGSNRTQFVTENPDGLRWNDAGEPSPYRTTPLYAAAQPMRQPLTDEQLRDILRDYDNLTLRHHWQAIKAMLRAVERAHGIGDAA